MFSISVPSEDNSDGLRFSSEQCRRNVIFRRNMFPTRSIPTAHLGRLFSRKIDFPTEKITFAVGNSVRKIIFFSSVGFVPKGQEDKVCHLKIFIYSLKQSCNAWYFRFHEAIISFGLHMVSKDHFMYIKKTTMGIMFLTLYIDDILLAGNNMEMIQTTQQWLSSVFKMKDMGEARYILGVEITRNRYKKLFGLSQEAYFNKILERFQMHYSKPMDTLVEKGLTLNLDQCPIIDEEKERMSNIPYASVVGSLMYAMLYTWPDICFAVGLVSCYQSNPGPAHWQAVKRIFQYLRGTSDLILCYQGGILR